MSLLLTSVAIAALLCAVVLGIDHAVVSKSINKNYEAFKLVSERHKALQELRTRGTESHEFMDSLVLKEMSRVIQKSIPSKRR